jgi:bifunctional UDP-N-acetylglucosamine pyrophosphorylase/glucosamine-1-phosphate N-acetyltransferase
VAGVPMLSYPVGLARELGCVPTVAVVGHGAQAVETALASSGVAFALQSQQLGTGHALLCAEPQLAGFCGTLLLLCGDVPLLRRQTLEALLHYHRAQQATVTVLTAHLSNPQGYGRIVRQGEEVLRIVEEKDASLQEKAIQEINTGIYALEAPFAFEALKTIGCDNAQGEYYLTDVLAAARAAGRRVCALTAGTPEETMGINDRAQLAEAGALMRQRINRELMLSGVTLVDPATTYIEPQVKIVGHGHSNRHGRCVVRCTIAELGARFLDHGAF